MLLQPLVMRLDSHLRDTKHVLQILEMLDWDETRFSWATVDVVGLYTCIPHKKGLEAVEYHLITYSNYDDTVIDFILRTLEYLLTHNFFKFDSAFYLQKCGTLMGAKFAPTYANLYMGWWEETRIFGGTMHVLNNIKLYKKYVDDLLFIWGDTQIEANIVSTVFRKETAGNTLLRADSCHPRHVLKAIPFGQFQRLRHRLLQRNYPINLLKLSFLKAFRIDRMTLLNDRKKTKNNDKKDDKPMFITSFSRQYHKIKTIVRKNLPILFNDESLHNILKDGCKFVTRRAPTLVNLLAPSVVPGKIKSKTWLQTKGTYKCGANRCITCERILVSKEFKSNSTGKSFKMNHFINCNTKFVTYLLSCSKCGIQYVGCTSRNLKNRMREHINHITSRRNSSVVSRHFLECSDGDIKYLNIQGIEKIEPVYRGGNLMEKLLHREDFWIFTLGTRQPAGLNLRFDIACHV
ncbi:hypothetical protein XELAEV_18035541mg [Xenopus laevis]|uniref:GIY-YIG domain-containing protein n=1 Tax=Xenopus laevis TaxID=8355 RepID=A0A974HC67_XENLA|nr:hypothetical protein XELAEV_18035541mg [Xenopus laevis]